MTTPVHYVAFSEATVRLMLLPVLLLPSDDDTPTLQILDRVCSLAGQALSAERILNRVEKMAAGEIKPSEAEEAAYRGAALDAAKEGRTVQAAAMVAAGRFERILLDWEQRARRNDDERSEDYRIIELHQGIARDLGDVVNAAHDQLDVLGVPRLPAPFDRSVSMRIEVLTAMRQRVVLGVDHGEGKARAAWTVIQTTD